MIKPFKLLKGYTYSDEYTLPTLPDLPFGMSRRHWNMLPQDLRGGERENMELYIEGWEACLSPNLHVNPYLDINNPEVIQRRELWNRGYMVCMNRRTRTYTERDMAYYHTEEFLFFDVSEVRHFVHDGFPYKVLLYRHIEEGNTVEGQTIYPDHPMYYFPDVM